MDKDAIKTIGKKQSFRGEAIFFKLKDIEGLVETLEKDFSEWSDFDRWTNLDLQQWIFSRAMDVYLGKKIDIKCHCCDAIDTNQIDGENIPYQKCYGIRTAYMIEKVVDEIELAKERRESDGTYLT